MYSDDSSSDDGFGPTVAASTQDPAGNDGDHDDDEDGDEALSDAADPEAPRPATGQVPVCASYPPGDSSSSADV